MSTHPDDLPPSVEPAELGSLGRPGGSGLGSLAQSARHKHIRQARRILIGVGIIIALFQTGMYFKESSDLKNEERTAVARNPDAREEIQAEVAVFDRQLFLFH